MNDYLKLPFKLLYLKFFHILARCTSCSRGFDTEWALTEHAETHVKGKRTVECEFCGKLFVSLQQLEVIQACSLGRIKVRPSKTQDSNNRNASLRFYCFLI